MVEWTAVDHFLVLARALHGECHSEAKKRPSFTPQLFKTFSQTDLTKKKKVQPWGSDTFGTLGKTWKPIAKPRCNIFEADHFSPFTRSHRPGARRLDAPVGVHGGAKCLCD